MMIFWEAGLVLLAVPKTGTQALESATADYADVLIRNPPKQKHMPLRWYQNAVLPLFDGTERSRLQTVAVIREPVDWLGSWFRYRRRASLSGHANSTRHVDFGGFVEAYLAPDPPPFAAVGRQSRFVEDATGEVGVDHLFAFDRMPDLVQFLRERLRQPICLPNRNISPNVDLHLPPDLLARLKHECARDFELHKRLISQTSSSPWRA